MAGRKPEKPEAWFEDACELMVLENLPLRRAAERLGVMLTPQECDNIYRRKSFRDCLDDKRFHRFEEVGSDPRRTKSVLLGVMFNSVQKLYENGEFKEALNGALQLAKVEYNIEGEAAGNLGLSQREIDEVKARLKAIRSPEAVALLEDTKLAN